HSCPVGAADAGMHHPDVTTAPHRAGLSKSDAIAWSIGEFDGSQPVAPMPLIALRRLRDAGEGAGRDAEGVELRSDQYQGVRYADRGPEGEPAGQPGEHEAVLHPGRQLVER